MPADDRSRSSVGRRHFLSVIGASAVATGLAGCTVRTTEDGVEVDFENDDGDSPAVETTGMPMQTTTRDDTPAPSNAPSNTTTSAAATPTSKPQQRMGGTLQLTSGTLTMLDPIAATDSSSMAVLENLFDGLTTFPNGETTAELQLATDVTISADGRTYTISLREGATFHDGSQVTASDVVYSWERLAASDNSRRAYYLLEYLNVAHGFTGGGYVPGSMAVRAVDDTTLRFRLAKPNFAALELLAHPAFAIVPEGIVGDIDGYVGRMSYQSFAESPIGSGPFVFEHWNKTEEVTVTRYDDYHGTAPDLDGIRWRVLTDSTAAYNYGQNRNADFVTVPDAEYDPRRVRIAQTDDSGRRFGEYGPMENGETVSYLSAPLAQTFYIGFNTNRVHKPVRVAMAYGLNQQWAVNRALNTRATPAAHLTPPPIYPHGGYQSHADSEYPYSYDAAELQAARRVMEDAGYGPSNRYQFTLTSYSSSVNKKIGQRLQDTLAAAHIDLRYEETHFSSLINRGYKGNVDAYFLGWVPDYPNPDNFLENLNPPATETDGSPEGFYLNWGGTAASQTAARAWQRVESSLEPTERARQNREAAYVTMEEANWEDVALLPLYHPIDERFAYDDVTVDPFGGLGSTYQEYNTVVKGE